MSVKDKVIFGLMVLLIIGGGYIQYSYTEIVKQLDDLKQEQLKHVAEVNKEFRADLRKLNLQFIGRGKHVRRAQQDIIVNTDLIAAMTDSLTSLIDDVNYTINELDREIRKRFNSIEQDITDLEDSFNSKRRRDITRFSDLEQQITTLQNSLKELEDLSIIQTAKTAKEKKKE